MRRTSDQTPRAAALAGLALALAPGARAQDDGPRVYQLAPKDAQAFTGFYVAKRGNEGPEPGEVFAGTETKNDILVLRYARTFSLAGRQFAPFMIVPTGAVRSSGPAGSFESSGLGDIQIGGVLGVLGSPALTPEAYAAFRPGFTTGLLARAYFPTGDYSSARPVNLGANIFTVQLGLPTTVMLGRSFRDPSLTALELLPTVNLYTRNDDPFRAREVSKAPLFSVESHLTHNFGRARWASFDVLFRSGAETTTDGVADHNRTEGWSAGGSGALVLPRRISLILTYEHVVQRNDNGPDGWFFRTALVKVF
jgi:hypothetical protein